MASAEGAAGGPRPAGSRGRETSIPLEREITDFRLKRAFKEARAEMVSNAPPPPPSRRVPLPLVTRSAVQAAAERAVVVSCAGLAAAAMAALVTSMETELAPLSEDWAIRLRVLCRVLLVPGLLGRLVGACSATVEGAARLAASRVWVCGCGSCCRVCGCGGCGACWSRSCECLCGCSGSPVPAVEVRPGGPSVSPIGGGYGLWATYRWAVALRRLARHRDDLRSRNRQQVQRIVRATALRLANSKNRRGSTTSSASPKDAGKFIREGVCHWPAAGSSGEESDGGGKRSAGSDGDIGEHATEPLPGLSAPPQALQLAMRAAEGEEKEREPSFGEMPSPVDHEQLRQAARERALKAADLEREALEAERKLALSQQPDSIPAQAAVSTSLPASAITDMRSQRKRGANRGGRRNIHKQGIGEAQGAAAERLEHPGLPASQDDLEPPTVGSNMQDSSLPTSQPKDAGPIADFVVGKPGAALAHHAFRASDSTPGVARIPAKLRTNGKPRQIIRSNHHDDEKQDSPRDRRDSSDSLESRDTNSIHATASEHDLQSLTATRAARGAAYESSSSGKRSRAGSSTGGGEAALQLAMDAYRGSEEVALGIAGSGPASGAGTGGGEEAGERATSGSGSSRLLLADAEGVEREMARRRQEAEVELRAEAEGLEDWAPDSRKLRGEVERRLQEAQGGAGRWRSSESSVDLSHDRALARAHDTEGYIPVWRRPCKDLAGSEESTGRFKKKKSSTDRTTRSLARGRKRGKRSRSEQSSGAVGSNEGLTSKTPGHRLALVGSRSVEPGSVLSGSGSSELDSSQERRRAGLPSSQESRGSRKRRKGKSSGESSRSSRGLAQSTTPFAAIMEKYEWDGMGTFVGGSMGRGSTLRYWGVWGAEGDGEALGTALEQEGALWPGQRFPLLEHQQTLAQARGVPNAAGSSTYSGSGYFSSGALSSEARSEAESEVTVDEGHRDRMEVEAMHVLAALSEEKQAR